MTISRTGFEKLAHFFSQWKRDDQFLVGMGEKWARRSGRQSPDAGRYFELTRGQAGTPRVDDRTWRDLEMDAIFSDFDTTVSPVGAQVLYHQLRNYVDDDSRLDRDHELYARLVACPQLRDDIQLALAPLRHESNAAIVEPLFGALPQSPRWLVFRFLSAALMPPALAIALLVPGAKFLLLLLLLWNALSFLYIEPQLRQGTLIMERLGTLLGVAERLATISTGEKVWQLEKLREQQAARKELRRVFRWFSIDRDSNLAVGITVWYLNFLFLVDQIYFSRAKRQLTDRRGEFAEMFALVGSIDAAVAVASITQRGTGTCRSRAVAGRTIDMRDAVHPLIDGPTPNSVSLHGSSALVTGTNMAGKTTFIKTVAVNIILGRTLGFCLAASATIPRSPVMAAIRHDHSVQSGRSQYFAEMEAVLELLRAAESGTCEVFVVDELFRGTNTVERVAAGKAVLDALGRSGQVLATTHDVELQGMLGPNFLMFHFQEDPDHENIFDYRIRSGPGSARNAIKLLERTGFPPAVVAEARRVCESIEKSAGPVAKARQPAA